MPSYTQTERVAMIAKALRKAIAEHGAPNSFSPGELQMYGFAFWPFIYGKLAPFVVATLRAEGYELEYGDRVFRVAKDPTDA